MCGVDWQEAHAQPRCVMSTKGTQGHLLHGMIEGPEGLIETGANGRLFCPLINVAYQLRDARPEDGGFCLIPGEPGCPCRFRLSDSRLEALGNQCFESVSTRSEVF